MKMFLKNGRFVGKNSNVVQTGQRAGEIIYRVSVSDGEGIVTDILFGGVLKPADFDRINLFSDIYDMEFDYSQRTFNGKSYIGFYLVGFSPAVPKR